MQFEGNITERQKKLNKKAVKAWPVCFECKKPYLTGDIVFKFYHPSLCKLNEAKVSKNKHEYSYLMDIGKVLDRYSGKEPIVETSRRIYELFTGN